MFQIFLIFIFIVVFIFFVRYFIDLFFAKMALKSIKTWIKDNYNRHREGNYTEFEENVLRKILAPQFFSYYYVYCQNERIFKDLKSRLVDGEVITGGSSTLFMPIRGIMPRPFRGIFFQSSRNRFFIYKIDVINLFNSRANFLIDFSLSDIKSVDGKIKPGHLKILKFGVPASIKIRLKNKKVISMIFGCLIMAEELNAGLKGLEEADYARLQLEKVRKMKGKVFPKVYQELEERALQTNESLYEGYLKFFTDT